MNYEFIKQAFGRAKVYLSYKILGNNVQNVIPW